MPVEDSIQASQMRPLLVSVLGPVLLVAAATSTAAHAQQAAPAVEVSAKYVVDALYVANGAANERTFLVDDADLDARFDLDRLVGGRGLAAGFRILGTGGSRPNDAAGTLQGIDNAEAATHRVKIYEAWLEQSFAGGRGSFRLGLTDLNADFYQNDSAGLLIAPAFGIGSELAATGPNGPSIFPSTALTARLALRLGASGYARLAVVGAKAGVIGDPGGVDLSMRDGALVIAEAGLAASGKIALGVWRYTRRQDDIYATDSEGRPVRQVANGAYLLIDRHVAGDAAHAIDLFGRVGLSDGKTTSFRGGFQAGILVAAPLRARPDGRLSFGIQQGLLSRGFRRALEEEGHRADPAEYGVELTYADKLLPWLTVQPDLQYVRRAYGDGNGRGTLIFNMRLTFTKG